MRYLLFAAKVTTSVLYYAFSAACDTCVTVAGRSVLAGVQSRLVPWWNVAPELGVSGASRWAEGVECDASRRLGKAASACLYSSVA